MIKIFSSPFKVTQKFGVNKSYYKQYGLAGHEGIDIIPTGGDFSIFSMPFKGKVVKDIDMKEKGGNYGVTCTIWYPEIDEAFQYCHLNTNTVYEGQEIEPGYYLGQMGATGNTTGAHLHLNRFKVDKRGVRLNKDNGYLGGIDPLPFLEETEHRPEAQSSIPSTQADSEKRAMDVLRNAFNTTVLDNNVKPFKDIESMVRSLVDTYQNYFRLREQLEFSTSPEMPSETEDPVFKHQLANLLFQLAKAIG